MVLVAMLVALVLGGGVWFAVMAACGRSVSPPRERIPLWQWTRTDARANLRSGSAQVSQFTIARAGGGPGRSADLWQDLRPEDFGTPVHPRCRG